MTIVMKIFISRLSHLVNCLSIYRILIVIPNNNIPNTVSTLVNISRFTLKYDVDLIILSYKLHESVSREISNTNN